MKNDVIEGLIKVREQQLQTEYDLKIAKEKRHREELRKHNVAISELRRTLKRLHAMLKSPTLFA